jgi:hypothetical protein
MDWIETKHWFRIRMHELLVHVGLKQRRVTISGDLPREGMLQYLRLIRRKSDTVLQGQLVHLGATVARFHLRAQFLGNDGQVVAEDRQTIPMSSGLLAWFNLGADVTGISHATVSVTTE